MQKRPEKKSKVLQNARKFCNNKSLVPGEVKVNCQRYEVFGLNKKTNVCTGERGE